MKSFAVLILNIGFAVLFVFGGMHAASALMTEPSQERKLDMNAQTVWTSAPVHVDHAAQSYERLATPPDPYPFKFRADRKVKTVDSATFQLEGKLYRLAGAPVIDRRATCKDAEGRRYACGLNAFKALDKALRGRFVECRVETASEDRQTAECRVGGRDLALLL